MRSKNRYISHCDLRPISWVFVLLAAFSAQASSIFWTNTAGGDWNTAANWSPNQVPGSADDAFITTNGTYTVTDSGTNTINNLTLGGTSGTQTFNLSGGTFTLNGAGSANAQSLVILSGATLSGSGNLTVSGAMTWTYGSMTGTGQTIISPGAMLTWSATNSCVLSRTLDNRGTIICPNSIGVTGVITNEAGALFQVTNGIAVNPFGNPGRLDNAGTLQFLGGATEFYGVKLNNFNSMDIQAGTLFLGQAGDGSLGTNSGAITVEQGATLEFSGGSYTTTATSTITGAGNLIMDIGGGGGINLGGLVNLSGTNSFENGTAGFTGDYICTNNTLYIEDGSNVSFDGTDFVSPPLFYLGGNLEGSANVTVGGTMNWNNGAILGSGRIYIPPGSTLKILPAEPLGLDRTLDNGGTTTLMGIIGLGFSSVITNRPGALFDLQGTGVVNGPPGRIDNAGTLRKSVNTNGIYIDVSITNYGTVDVQSGILAAQAGYVSASNAVINSVIGTNYGLLQITGATTLQGTLNVSFTNNYIPTTNNSFTVLTAGSVNGTFANFTYPSNLVAMMVSYTTTSVVVRVTPPLPPTIAITNPANNASFASPASIAIGANVSDPDTSITSVTYFDGANQLVALTNAPYAFAWTNAALGAHTLTAVVTDALGLSTTSSPVNISVVKTPVVMLAVDSLQRLGLTGTIGTTYAIQSRASLTSGSWTNVSTNSITNSGFNLALPKPTNITSVFYRALWLGY